MLIVQHPPASPAALAAVLLTAALASGCTTASVAPSLVARAPQTVPQLTPASVAATRQGRYTLVELVPEPAQRDLMQQVVEIDIPPTLDVPVGDAMRHVLARSGYRLCSAADAKTLYDLPLPAAHRHLGPLTLRDALLTLAGPAWDLSIDDANRQVCWTRRASSAAVSISTVGGTAIEPPEVRP